MTSTPISLPEETNYKVSIHADTRTLKVGENITLTGTTVGSFGNPLYSIKVQDQAIPQSVLQVRLTRSNEVREKEGTSNVLTLVSTSIDSNQVTMVFQGRGPGIAEVSFSINGEIGEVDGSGPWWFNYVTKFSEDLAITVTAQ